MSVLPFHNCGVDPKPSSGENCLLDSPGLHFKNFTSMYQGYKFPFLRSRVRTYTLLRSI